MAAHRFGRLLAYEVKFRAADVGDATRIVCVFGDGKGKVEIYFEKARFASQLKTLSGILLRSDLDFAEIKYIDLRFTEPLIGKKKARK